MPPHAITVDTITASHLLLINFPPRDRSAAEGAIGSTAHIGPEAIRERFQEASPPAPGPRRPRPAPPPGGDNGVSLPRKGPRAPGHQRRDPRDGGSCSAPRPAHPRPGWRAVVNQLSRAPVANARPGERSGPPHRTASGGVVVDTATNRRRPSGGTDDELRADTAFVGRVGAIVGLRVLARSSTTESSRTWVQSSRPYKSHRTVEFHLGEGTFSVPWSCVAPWHYVLRLSPGPVESCRPSEELSRSCAGPALARSSTSDRYSPLSPS